MLNLIYYYCPLMNMKQSTHTKTMANVSGRVNKL